MARRDLRLAQIGDVLRFREPEQAVGADAEMPVAQLPHLIGGRLETAVRIQIRDEIIAGRMRLGDAFRDTHDCQSTPSPRMGWPSDAWLHSRCMAARLLRLRPCDDIVRCGRKRMRRITVCDSMGAFDDTASRQEGLAARRWKGDGI